MKNPYFEKIRLRVLEQRLDPIRKDAGECFQLLISKAEDDLHKPWYGKLFQAIANLADDESGDPYPVDYKEAVILRSALAAVRAGCDARIRAAAAYDAFQDKAPNVRARKWADEYGMESANRSVKSGNRTALNQLLAYVQHLYENTEDGTDPTNASRSDRMRAVEYVNRSFKLSSADAAIKSLLAARRSNFVKELWPNELLPLSEIRIPSRGA